MPVWAEKAAERADKETRRVIGSRTEAKPEGAECEIEGCREALT